MRLVIVPSLPAFRSADGGIVLTRKFVDAMVEYARNWPGVVHVVMAPATGPDDNLDRMNYAPGMPFTIEVVDLGDAAAMARSVGGAEAILGALDYRQFGAAHLCRRLRIPAVFVAECTLRTRRQIIRAEVRNPLRRWRRSLREGQWEREFCRMARLAAGIQCNGTPTYEAYRKVNPRALLYFDSRVSADMLISPEDLERKSRHVLAGGPLRLTFSGRLIAIKGVDHLPRVAAVLRRMGVAFTMDIYGGGNMEGSLRQALASHGLQGEVRVRGVVDFRSELVPAITRGVDLFVCCHRQGDPSCTYMETLACGTPIAGYDNEALAGLIARRPIGWCSPMDRPEALAEVIRRLDADRPALARAMAEARAFAEENLFEATMRRRTEHILECARAWRRA